MKLLITLLEGWSGKVLMKKLLAPGVVGGIVTYGLKYVMPKADAFLGHFWADLWPPFLSIAHVWGIGIRDIGPTNFTFDPNQFALTAGASISALVLAAVAAHDAVNLASQNLTKPEEPKNETPNQN